MSVLTIGELHQILPYAAAALWIEPLNAAMAQFGIHTPKREAMFVAQCGHESQQLTCLDENLNYDRQQLLEKFGRYLKHGARDAAILAHRPEAIANQVYANRMGNGDEASGDGYRYRSRGLLQLTGRSLYALAGKELGENLLAQPEKLLEPLLAARSAAWYFTQQMPGLQLADKGDLQGCTLQINGGLDGLTLRRILYQRACRVLGVPIAEPQA